MDSILPIFAAMALALGAVLVLGYEGGLLSNHRAAKTEQATPAAPALKAASTGPASTTASAGPAPVVASQTPTPVTAAAKPVAVPAPADSPPRIAVFPMAVEASDAFAAMTTPGDAIWSKDRQVPRTAVAPTRDKADISTLNSLKATNGLDQMGFSVNVTGDAAPSTSLLDAPTPAATEPEAAAPAADAPRSQGSAGKLDAKSTEQPDMFADPMGDVPARPTKTPPKHPQIFDASENTPMDPLRNKSFDLNSGKSVPADLVH